MEDESGDVFKVGDICDCSYGSRKKVNGLMVKYKQTEVRIVSVNANRYNTTYNVYNITLDKYESFGRSWLKLNVARTREEKMNKILK